MENKKKTIVDKFKEQPLPIKLLGGIFILWLYPFIESFIIGGSGFGDLSIISNILLGISAIPFAYMAWQFGIRPIIYWIGKIFKK